MQPQKDASSFGLVKRIDFPDRPALKLALLIACYRMGKRRRQNSPCRYPTFSSPFTHPSNLPTLVFLYFLTPASTLRSLPHLASWDLHDSPSSERHCHTRRRIQLPVHGSATLCYIGKPAGAQASSAENKAHYPKLVHAIDRRLQLTWVGANIERLACEWNDSLEEV